MLKLKTNLVYCPKCDTMRYPTSDMKYCSKCGRYLLPQPKTPVCDKLSEVWDDLTTIRDFFEWLDEKQIHLMIYDEHDRGIPICIPRERLFHDYFNIDEIRLEEDRRALLEYMREINKS